jgi:hypothetical protein
MLTRKEFLRIFGGASAVVFSGRMSSLHALAQDAGASSTSSDVARIARVIEEYDLQGIHRTGTEVDNRSASWLVEQAKAAGATARIEPFAVNRVDIRSAYVEVGGRRIEGLPLFDGTFTDERGHEGVLAPSEARTDIGLLTIEAGAISSEGRGLADLRRSGIHKAIVVVTRGAHAGLTPMNAAEFAKPYGCPVLQVSSEEANWLNDYAKQKTNVRVVAHATPAATHAYNVIAAVNGRRTNLDPVIVMTPRSGWWNCASERGGGLACWLEIARAVNEARPARTVRFIASSGHELGHFGLDAFLQNQPKLIKSAAAWMHLGANIGAAGGRPRLQASSNEIEKLAATALTRANTDVEQRLPRGTVPGGEARNIHVGGGRYISLLGSSPVFHSQADRWPSAVDVPAVARFARALSDLAIALANQT